MKVDKTVVVIGLIMFGILAAYLLAHRGSGIQQDPKYKEVASKVGPQFDKITQYLERVESAYRKAANVPVREVKEAGKKKVGDFMFKVANVSEYGGKLGYCLVAEHILNQGRAYHSSMVVNDPTWQGKRSYHHYVTGQEPAPDLDGPCNETVIRRR